MLLGLKTKRCGLDA